MMREYCFLNCRNCKREKLFFLNEETSGIKCSKLRSHVQCEESGEEDELYVKPLQWRCSLVEKFFVDLHNEFQQAKLSSEVSSKRPSPLDLPRWAMTSFCIFSNYFKRLYIIKFILSDNIKCNRNMKYLVSRILQKIPHDCKISCT